MKKSQVVQRGRKVIAPTLGWETELVAVRARGYQVTCDDGRTYVDFTAGTAVLNTGHRHPKVIRAAKAQMDRLVHSGGNYWFEPMVTCAEKLAEICPGDIGMFFFSNSGAEAVEGCIKMARYVTGRPAIIAMNGAFHGRTLACTALTTSAAKYRHRYAPFMPEVYRIPFPYPYRMTEDNDPEEATRICLDHLDGLFTRAVRPDQVAAILVEPMQGEGGYIPATRTFLKELRRITRRHGILLVFDEVQTGMGRTCRWWGSEHFDVVPDAMAIAKGVASGFPLSVVAASPRLMAKWTTGAHGTTFGGNPVSCAAAATIDVIREEDLLAKGMKKAEFAMKRLEEIRERHRTVGDVRGLGLMIGIELVKRNRAPDPEALSFVKAHWRKAGFLIHGCGTYGNGVRFIPPLNTPKNVIAESLGVLDDALTRYEKRKR